MPIYEYRCDACQYTLDALQKITDTPLKTCPACGQENLSKLMSASAFHLKGQGWYKTDYNAQTQVDRATSKNTDVSVTTDTKSTQNISRSESKPLTDSSSIGK